MIFITGKSTTRRLAACGTTSFNGAGDLHHRKVDALRIGRLHVIIASTEPVIFITGKGSHALTGRLHRRVASTEPVIFITGKAPPEMIKLAEATASTEPVIFITGKA